MAAVAVALQNGPRSHKGREDAVLSAMRDAAEAIALRFEAGRAPFTTRAAHRITREPPRRSRDSGGNTPKAA